MSSNEGSRRLQALTAAATMGFCCVAMGASPHFSLVGSLPADSSGGLIRPQSIVFQDGRLYGVAAGDYNMGGQDGIFSMTLQGAVSVLHAFDESDGWSYETGYSENYRNLVQLKDGSLFGTNTQGGPFDYQDSRGTAFAVSPDGRFQRVHGYSPSDDLPAPTHLVVDSDGDIFGLSGTYLAALTPDGAVAKAFDFQGQSAGNLAAGPSGELYVTLPEGGQPPGDGDPSSLDGIYKVRDGVGTLVHALASDESEGRFIADLVVDAQGNLYGSTLTGGGHRVDGMLYPSDGTVFKITPAGAFSTLHSFQPSTEAASIPSDLMVGSDGSVYGVALVGGAHGMGALFKVAPNGHYSVLHEMGPEPLTDGGNPRGLIQGGPRTFYGVVDGGAHRTGAIFKLVVPIQDDVTGDGTSSLILTGPSVLSTGPVTGAGSRRPVTAGYRPVAAGDFDGDGIADILWTSTRHDLYIWLGRPGGFTSRYAGTYPAGWKVVGAGDFDADGKDDLAWINASTRQFAYWLMNGATRTGSRTVKYTAGYFPVTVGDYDGDDRADVLWSSAKHDLYAWLSHGQGFSSKFVASFPAAWKISGRGDLDGDGKADLVWSTSDGARWGYWLMDGSTVRTTRNLAVPAAVSGSRVATVADYDGDGVADVLWSDGHALTLWENRGGCLDTPGCAFSQSVPSMTLSTGQTVFNSGLPVRQ